MFPCLPACPRILPGSFQVLSTGARYAFLFRLKITDYKGWARGLKSRLCNGSRYAQRLIDIIELYDLDKYDRKDGLKWAKENPNPHQPYLANELVYVIARKEIPSSHWVRNLTSATANSVNTTNFPRIMN